MEYMPICKLNMGDRDAVNYNQRSKKAFFDSVFLVDKTLYEACEDGKYFIIGEKGTGKTAYAVYLSNRDFQERYSSLKFIKQTDYQKFMAMKHANHLMLSDYVDIWKVILYFLLSLEIKKCLKSALTFNGTSGLDKCIEEYNKHKFSPEIINGISLVETVECSAKLTSIPMEAGVKGGLETTTNTQKIQSPILSLNKEFEEAISKIKIKNSFTLFIDGIDLAPTGIDHQEYLDCIKGLTQAAWDINTDFLANIRDLGGKSIKVMLLMRPDIFPLTGLHNINSKINDNSVLLRWTTKYEGYNSSTLFKMIDRLLANQQNNKQGYSLGDAWDHYFPYTIWSGKTESETDSSFIDFLRYSFHRPRDILALLNIMKKNAEEENADAQCFSKNDFTKSRTDYSRYLLGEIHEQFLFHYSEEDYVMFLKFFEQLDGLSEFGYDYYLSSYEKYKTILLTNNLLTPSFAETAETFIQLLYSLNIICYRDSADNAENFYHWSFRERSYANLNPQVKLDSFYRIHRGLFKSLNVGKRFYKQ